MSDAIDSSILKEKSESGQPSDMEKAALIHRDVHADWYLATMVEWVRGSNIEIGVTLQVGGILVTGNLVSGHRYFDAFAEDFSGVFEDPEIKESIRKNVAQNGDRYRGERPELAQGEFDAGPAFIHLRNAFYLVPGSAHVPTSEDGVWWRGRLTQVDAFNLGTLTQS